MQPVFFEEEEDINLFSMKRMKASKFLLKFRNYSADKDTIIRKYDKPSISREP